MRMLHNGNDLAGTLLVSPTTRGAAAESRPAAFRPMYGRREASWATRLGAALLAPLLAGPAQAAPFAYVTNLKTNSVSVVDTATNTVIATVPVGTFPRAAAVSPNGSRVYVTNGSDNTVSVLDTSDNTVITTVAVGGQPHAVAVSPTGLRAYVTNADDETVSVLNTLDNTVIATVPVGGLPFDVAVSPNGSRVFVPNASDNTVSVLNTANNRVVATVTVGRDPRRLVVRPDGARAYVSNVNDGTVSVLNTSNNTVVATVKVTEGFKNGLGGCVWPLAISPDGSRVYASDYCGDTISVLDTSTNMVLNTPTMTRCVWEMALGTDGSRLYGVDVCGGTLKVLDTASGAIVATVSLGGVPSGVALGPPPATPTATPIPTPTAPPSAVPTSTPTATPPATLTSTATPPATPTSTFTATATATHTPTASPTDTPARLVADALEVTQAVQDLNNRVRLVAGKRTFVRFHVRSEGKARPATAKLDLRLGQLTRSLSPSNVGGEIQVLPKPQRSQLEHAFFFEIPSEFLGATGPLESDKLELTGRILDSNTGLTLASGTPTTVKFESVPSMQLRYFDVDYKGRPTNTPTPTGSPNSMGTPTITPDIHRDHLFDWLKRAYPISELDGSADAVTFTFDALPTCGKVNSVLTARRQRELNANKKLPTRTRYYGMVRDAGQPLRLNAARDDVDHPGFMRGCAVDLPSFVASGPTGTPPKPLIVELRACFTANTSPEQSKLCLGSGCPIGDCLPVGKCVGGPRDKARCLDGPSHCMGAECRVQAGAFPFPLPGVGGWNKDDSYGDYYGGHELGHTFGRFHQPAGTTGYCVESSGKRVAGSSCKSEKDCGMGEACQAEPPCGGVAAFPHPQPVNNPGGSISPVVAQDKREAVFGFDAGRPIRKGADLVVSKAIYPPTWTDMMTYCDDEWISDFTTHGLMDQMQKKEGQCAGAADTGIACFLGATTPQCSGRECVQMGLCFPRAVPRKVCTGPDECPNGNCLLEGLCIGGPDQGKVCLDGPTDCSSKDCRKPAGLCVGGAENAKLCLPGISACAGGQCLQLGQCADYADAGTVCTDGPTGSTQCMSGMCLKQGGAGAGIIEAMSRLQVVGFIDRDTGDVSLEPFFILPDAGELEPRVPGDYAIVLSDAADDELARYPFSASVVTEEDAPIGQTDPPRTLLFFSELVPYVDGTARVDIEGPDGLLATVTAGMTPPDIEVLSPNGGEDLAADEVLVEWAAEDADGDPLTFDVEYTTDDGETWIVVAQSITETSVAIDRRNLTGSTRARFRVWATDGIHTSGDESDGVLTVENQPPDAEIVDPTGDRTIVAGTTLGLLARAIDDSGFMDGEQIQWRSSLDGALGGGLFLGVSTLGVGTHTITMTADDGDGGITEDSVEVVVVSDLSDLSIPDDGLEVGPSQLAFGAGTEQATITIDNANIRRSIGWNATTSEPWLVLETAAGTTPAQVQVSFDRQGLLAGKYEATLTFTSPDVPDESVVIDIDAVIAVVSSSACVGDCDGGGFVTVNELITGINIALGNAEIGQCPVFDALGDVAITVDELVQGLNNALTGCPA